MYRGYARTLMKKISAFTVPKPHMCKCGSVEFAYVGKLKDGTGWIWQCKECADTAWVDKTVPKPKPKK